ncbi:MAG TPA: recombinase family protein [Candidatus Paceibacterota bacterium]|nr:recombinase family protein [Candidatus Paceibacterota bacterium]
MEQIITQPTLLTPLQYCLYARKSTESEEQQILSIDSQIKEMLELAKKENLNVSDIKQESHSAKATGQRAVFNQMIQEIQEGKFNAVITWAPDRLSRNAGDLGKIVDLMDQNKLSEIRTFAQKFTNSPNEKFLLMILGSQAKLENDNKGINVKRGLRAKCEMGLWPAMAPTGYLNEKRTDRKGQVIIDPKRAHIIRQMFEKVANDQRSGRNLYRWLKDEISFKTKNGKYLSLANVYIILKNPFYCGIFEHPRNSGKWYTGRHTPLINKEIFDRVQQQIERSTIMKSQDKEFVFTKLIKCGLCGSGITANEKFKKLKDGGTNRHVYYGCTKVRDINCKCGYVKEEELLNQVLNIIDKIDLDRIGMKEKIEKEVERYHKFRLSVLGINEEQKRNKDIDIRNYAKYILKEGTVFEKRELLCCLKSKLVLKNKELSLEN